MTLPDPPDFLRRIPAKENTMAVTPATTTATPKPKKRRQDCYTARAVIEIPLDMANADKLNACMSNATPTAQQEECLKSAAGTGNG